MRAGVYTEGGQGLPQASPTPLVHIEDAAGTLTSHKLQAIGYVFSCTQTHQVVAQVTVCKLHTEMSKHLGLQYVGGGFGPLVNLRKYNQHCT